MIRSRRYSDTNEEGGRRRPVPAWAATMAALSVIALAGVIGVTSVVHAANAPARQPDAGSPAATALAIAPEATITVPTTSAAPVETKAPPTTQAVASTITAPPTTQAAPSTITAPPIPQAIASPAPGGDSPPAPSDVTPQRLRLGDQGPAVEKLQADLQALGFRPGSAIDGNFGSSTASAVMAFQKFEGIDRDGIAGSQVLDHLANPTGATPRWTGSGPHLEVDLARQLVFAWTGDGQRTILNASTGSGGTYLGAGGTETRAITPTGDFVIERRIDGVRESYLGRLYRPLYFHQGWAVHGSDSVPAQPASHGCVRVSNTDQDWLFAEFADGTSVSIA